MSDSTDFAHAALGQRRSSFLSLSPATSDSYPRNPSASQTRSRPRRASSSASASGHKILKLSPVHWGAHIDENQDDFYFEDDVVASEKKPSSSSSSSSQPSVSSGGFLSLAPDTRPAPKQRESSADYPSRRSSSASTVTSSSSASTSDYTSMGFKVLKLAPVYGGDDADAQSS